METNATTIRIAGVYRESIVDGPGIRFTVFCQGCSHACPGCHNPETHDFNGGYDCDIDKIVTEILKNPLLDGVTLTGGDPIFQSEGHYVLAKKIKEQAPNLNILIYTGFTYEELLERSEEDIYTKKLLELTDYLIDGRFVMEQRDLTLLFRGSKNQRFIDLNATREKGEIVLFTED
ncbi:MAG: anaerobic ribonucleoside-triphosphate reductase activating protein [Firmicutes bacterium]|nr:anaerobic ribonucleoside-triphosphate reductase activating protein [Bacillota bacterium]MBQ3123345.1 anaerobic ribonucleoside-triphosphate reductase activating protein [Bacillota bacterium]